MRQCIFMKIQLHLSHTILESEKKFLNAAWQLQTTIRRRFSAKERVTLLSGHRNGDTQLLNLGTVSSTHVKAARNKCLNLKIKITFLLKYPVCAINRAIFSRLNGLTQWLPKWGKLPPRVICDFLGVPGDQNVVLFCFISDHCEILRVIRHNRYTFIRVTAGKCLGTIGLTDLQLVRVICIRSAK